MAKSSYGRALRITGAALVGAAAMTIAVAIADPGHGPGGGRGYWGAQMGPYGQMPMTPGMMMGPHGGAGSFGGAPMGPGLMMGSGAEHGRWHWHDGARSDGDVKEADIKRFLERRLQLQGLKRLKVGKIEKGEKRITADVTTNDGSLVQRYEFDRRSGRIVDIN